MCVGMWNGYSNVEVGCTWGGRGYGMEEYECKMGYIGMVLVSCDCVAIVY